MNKHLIIAVLLSILSSTSYAQIVFEDGYFINESDQRIDCLIKDMDWKDNPRGFEYKTAPDALVQKANIKTVQEFGITGATRFIKAVIDIDRSSDDVQSLSSVRNPVFQKDTLLLKVIIEGKASLYEYVDGNLVRFFYKVEDREMSQLVYKRYNNPEGKVTTYGQVKQEPGLIATNYQFKQQLLVDLKCNEISKKEIENLRYTKKDLEKLFIAYNECTGSNFVNYTSKEKRDLFNLTLRPGVDFKSLSIQIPEVTDFGKTVNFRFGIEAEYILPYNKNKWGIIVEPTFQYFKSEKTTELMGSVPDQTRMVTAEVNYQSIELPIGVRYYVFLKDPSKIFINVSYSFHFDLNSNVDFIRSSDGSSLYSMGITSQSTFSFGGGYKYIDKYSVEMRYQMNRDIFSNNSYATSDYKIFSIILGYTLF